MANRIEGNQDLLELNDNKRRKKGFKNIKNAIIEKVMEAVFGYSESHFLTIWILLHIFM